MARRHGRHGTGYINFAALPREVFCSDEYGRLSVGARAVLIHMVLKYTGSNNGNLSVTADDARAAGLGSRGTFQRYKTELLNAGWMVITRQGGLENRCSLYALTYRGIDGAKVRYDAPWKAEPMPSHLWRDRNAHLRELRQPVRKRSRLTTAIKPRLQLVESDQSESRSRHVDLSGTGVQTNSRAA